ncbi:GNAT family N-acetyltransferase [Aureibacillus halotolerans]|uniref:Acetyltransferase (GNAT) family protein n=1 Tax=Aureibacillus halotolerans TaxID=1508390 RepID=A0A4R6U882_9BACI|nr:GNAT family N-acetyltransferase [Aureibacillus halotolerans]TDQ41153.1 acetyltransferase (GNAT) family protein [Aureibacillus halotolerans]
MNITQSKDIHLLAQLNEEVHSMHAAMYPERFKPYSYEAVFEAYKAKLDEPSNIFLLAEDEGQAVGYAWVELKNTQENPFKYETSTLYVHHFCISSKRRQKGYGKALLQAVEDLAREHDMTSVELDYWLLNTAAKAFYQKQGFVEMRSVSHKLL